MKRRIKVIALILTVFTFGFCISFATTNKVYTPETVYAAVYKEGSRGEIIKTIQTRLKKWGYYTGSIDGVFGTKTLAAVKLFQKRNGLTVDGIVGTKTLAAMGIKAPTSSTTTTTTTTTSKYSDADINLLAHLIYGEARGESYTGQVAVGAVVLNRIKSSAFPNTMSGVIYQKYAFTAVSDGQINLNPNDSAKKAAKDAMNGWDPTYGALYYYNPAIATSSWIFTRQTTIVIGRHVFAK